MQTSKFFKRVVTLFIAFFLGFSTTIAQANISNLPFYWEFMNVDIEVQTNGDMLVTETQKYMFNSAHSNQRYRYIPLDKVDAIKDVTVAENGEIIPSQVGR